MSNRRSVRRPTLLLGLAVSAVLLITACDDGADATPAAETASEAWASSVCGALATWEDSINTITTDFSDGISKDVVTEKVDDAGKATQDLVASLRDVGAPETDAGQDAKMAIEQFADELGSGVDSIKADVQDLADSGAGGVASGVTDIATQLSTLIADGQATLGDIQGLDAAEELRAAIENDETCQSLRAE